MSARPAVASTSRLVRTLVSSINKATLTRMRREQNPRRPRQNKELTDAAVQREHSQVTAAFRQA
jgi:hypothetical protein